ncbi:MAG: T9SS type A sorting domain-containing protein [Aureispira sp.]
MRILLSLLICCCLATFSAQGQQSRCSNSIFTNGNLESGTPTASHQDIGNAVGFSRIWAPNSWADYYTATTGPGGFSLPTPATGNYASCWIANHTNGGTTYREGFQAELGFTVPPNTGLYTLTFDAACMGGWGNSEVAVYALHNPGGLDAPNPPTGAFTPSNTALFGTGTTQLINIIPVSAGTCSNTKASYSFVINSNVAGFPTGGMTHIFITHSDNTSINGALYMAFDNFCMPIPRNTPCPASWVVNGDLESGTPTTSHQDINLATGFDNIWNGAGLSYADYYPATFAPSTFTPPVPATGDYAGCWIANFANGGRTYREGFQGSLASTILPNTGTYQLTFDMACLSGWGTAEVSVYGINNASTYSANPTSAYAPGNMALFGAANTALLGTFPVTTSSCNNTKTSQTVLIDSDASGFPVGGMSRFFITHSDNNGINGAHYMAFDNFCLQSRQIPPCPTIVSGRAECSRAGYSYTITTSGDAGSVTLSSSCGTFSPSTINLTGATSYTVTFIPNGSCGNNITVSYSVTNSNDVDCDRNRLQTTLPDCNGCECDESFFNNVEQGFDYYENCPNDFVRPFALQDDCDRVDWFIDGNYAGSTVGNAGLSFPHLTRTTEICMVVTRTTASGKTCEHKFCRRLEPTFQCNPNQRASSSSRLNATPNPATTQVTVTWDSRDLPGNISIGIFNSSGVVVKRMNDINGFDGSTRFNIMDLPTGLYYIKVEGEGYTPAPVKFIKQ